MGYRKSGHGIRGRMVLLPLTLAAALLLAPALAHGYRHHTSKIHYREYSTEVFEQARRDGKPIFVLLSAVWCYWCKYFDAHTLETEEVSSYLNRHWLNVFVDSDARADLTRKYVRGWPMTVLLHPDGRVQLSFPGALTKKDFLDIVKRVEGEIRSGTAAPAPAAPVLAAPLPVTAAAYRDLDTALVRYLGEHADPLYGGFGSGRKFPHPQLLAYLLSQQAAVRDPQRLALIEKTLDAILGSLHDPMAGGFFRYAERRDWSEAHTEKILHVNAGLALAFANAYEVFGAPRYMQAVDATLAFLLGTLYDDEAGGFYGSQTADPAYYRRAPQARRGLKAPGVNRDKITAWNAEAIVALLSLGERSQRQRLTDAALHSLEFMRMRLLSDKGMYHIYQAKAKRGALRGQLEANAWAALAFLEGHRVSGKDVYRQAGEVVLDYALAQLFDRQRGGFIAWNNPDHAGRSARTEELSLAANGLMAQALLTAYRLSGRPAYRDAAEHTLAMLGGQIKARLVEELSVPSALVAEMVYALTAYGKLLEKTPSARQGRTR
jgi:uncharacterized protein YyaL (SSP411 family)